MDIAFTPKKNSTLYIGSIDAILGESSRIHRLLSPFFHVVIHPSKYTKMCIHCRNSRFIATVLDTINCRSLLVTSISFPLHAF